VVRVLAARMLALLLATPPAAPVSEAHTEAHREIRGGKNGGLKQHLQFLSQLNPVPCRDDLATMAQRYFNVTGRAAEVGVNAGIFAQKNLDAWTGEYWAIDAWSIDSNVINQSDVSRPATRSIAAVDTNMFNKAATRIRPFGERAHMKRAFSIDAAADFPDEYFDWVYVDALHTHDAVMSDLRAWWPKVRVNGLVSGDDFADQLDGTEYVPLARTLQKYKWTYANAKSDIAKTQWGVVSAVQKFAAEVGAVVRVTYLDDCYSYPAWYIVKPPDYLHSQADA